jgi:hypothetical protein
VLRGNRHDFGVRLVNAGAAVMALAAVYVAAVVTTLSGLVWMLASRAWASLSERRWDRP